MNILDDDNFETFLNSFFSDDRINVKVENYDLKVFIENQIKQVIGDIVKRCAFDSVQINFKEDIFEVITKYRIPEDFGKIVDKNGNEIKLGAVVSFNAYYGIDKGDVVHINPITNKIDVKVKNGDIFSVEASECERA